MKLIVDFWGLCALARAHGKEESKEGKVLLVNSPMMEHLPRMSVDTASMVGPMDHVITLPDGRALAVWDLAGHDADIRPGGHAVSGGVHYEKDRRDFDVERPDDLNPASDISWLGDLERAGKSGALLPKHQTGVLQDPVIARIRFGSGRVEAGIQDEAHVWEFMDDSGMHHDVKQVLADYIRLTVITAEDHIKVASTTAGMGNREFTLRESTPGDPIHVTVSNLPRNRPGSASDVLRHFTALYKITVNGEYWPDNRCKIPRRVGRSMQGVYPVKCPPGDVCTNC